MGWWWMQCIASQCSKQDVSDRQHLKLRAAFTVRCRWFVFDIAHRFSYQFYVDVSLWTRSKPKEIHSVPTHPVERFVSEREVTTSSELRRGCIGWRTLLSRCFQQNAGCCFFDSFSSTDVEQKLLKPFNSTCPNAWRVVCWTFMGFANFCTEIRKKKNI